jgi:metal transporter CNNM
VAVNSLLSILLANKTSGIMGFLLSTGVIVVFGEITPQSVCSRHGLAVGYYTVWLVWIFLILLFPVAYPISAILNLLLGREIGTIYSRNELKKLLDIHSHHVASEIGLTEGAILSGALDFSLKEVSEVMTPIEDVFMLEIDERLDLETLTNILEKGYSRVPIFEKTTDSIVGLLFVKDLALLNPEHELPIRKVLPVFNRSLPRIFDDTNLAEVLREFKAGKSHIAVVRQVVNEGPGDPYYENVGVVTLEDVIEEIINDEIIDETDLYVDNRSGAPVLARDSLDYRRIRIHPTSGVGLTAQEGLDSATRHRLASYLADKFAIFHPKVIAPGVLSKLLAQSTLRTYEDGEHVYSQGQPESYFSVVISGQLSVQQSDGAAFTVQGGRGADSFPCICVYTLTDERFVPDINATACAQVSVLQITKRAYHSSLQATRLQRSDAGASHPSSSTAYDVDIDFARGAHQHTHSDSDSPAASASNGGEASPRPSVHLVGDRSRPLISLPALGGASDSESGGDDDEMDVLGKQKKQKQKQKKKRLRLPFGGDRKRTDSPSLIDEAAPRSDDR